MRILKTAMVVFFLALFSSFSQAQTKQVTIRYTSHCDHFEACETGKARMEKELGFTKGVKKLSFDPKASTVTVVYNSKKTDEQKIRQAIAKAGYDADEVKADPKGYAKLDECCRKKE